MPHLNLKNSKAMELQSILKKLRTRLSEYLFKTQTEDRSLHVNAIEIAVCLVEFALEDKRPIKNEEENWFKAAYHLSYVFPSGSEWEDLSELYCTLVDVVERKNYFRN